MRVSSSQKLFAVAAATASLLAAACTSDAGVSVEESTDASPSPTTEQTVPATEPAPDPTVVTTEATEPDEPEVSADVEEPDPTGLPELGGGDPDTATGTLGNGLRYMVRENDNPGGKVELRLVIDAGSGLEDDDQRGGAHFLEHMLFNGTERFPKNELIDELRSFGAAFGADINAYTSYDETVYTLNVPDTPDAVATALDILEEWLTSATLDPEDVDAERGIVVDEWRSRTETSNGRIFDRYSRFLLADSVYEDRLPIGGRDAIESITPEALRRFYDDWYRPDNAAVIVVGDIDVAEIEQEIDSRFSDVEARGSSPERVDQTVPAVTEPRVEIMDDPDLGEGFVTMALTAPRVATTLESDSQQAILGRIALDIIGTRLDSDALRGDAPYERASAGSETLVRLLSSPEVVVDVDAASVEASVEAILDEFERVARFGFTDAEVERAVASFRAAAQRSYDGRDSRQDLSYAEEYTRHILTGEWYVPAEREFEFVNEVLDRATPETVGFVIVERYRSSSASVFVAVPSAESADVADAADILAIAEAAPERGVEPRAEEEAIGDTLVEPPEPVEEVGVTRLSNDPFSPELDPMVLEFANGARVSLNATSIVDNELDVSAVSPGGLSLLADDLVADGQAAGSVIADSGAGAFDRVALEEFLDDKAVGVFAELEASATFINASAATTDIEVLFQLLHLLMSAPQVDQTAIDRYVDDRLPFATDPSLDVGYAEFDALLRARYDDPRFWLPTPEGLESVDRDGVLAVAQRVFADSVGSWTFSFSGDFDVDEVTDLARRYIGSLPAGADAGPTQLPAEPAPPAGVVSVETNGGEGETANVSFLMTGVATADRRDDVIAAIVREVVSNRLNDYIREELGDSYSPVAQLLLGTGAEPLSELYISVSAAPDRVGDVSRAVLDQLAALGSDGPTNRELSNAANTVAEQIGFVSNPQINQEALSVLVDPEGNSSFDDFVQEGALLGAIDDDDIRNALTAWIDLDQYIEVQVVPRG